MDDLDEDDKEEESPQDGELDSRRDRFRYILHFWKCREAFARAKFFQFFYPKAVDANSNKALAESSRESCSPSPPWFDTSSTRGTATDISKARAEVRKVRAAATTSFSSQPNSHPQPNLNFQANPYPQPNPHPHLYSHHYPHPHHHPHHHHQQQQPPVSECYLAERSAATPPPPPPPPPPPEVKRSRSGDSAGSAGQPTDHDALPWSQRWRCLFLLVACVCLGYVVITTLMALHSFLFWRAFPSLSSSSSSSSPLSSPSSPDPFPSPPDFISDAAEAASGGDGDGGCDWECFKFLFN